MIQPGFDDLSSGIASLYSRKLQDAKGFLERAASAYHLPAVPLSYLALAYRTLGDLDMARDALSRAKDADDACFEAYAADSAVWLTWKDLSRALAAWREATRRKPHGLEGHFLNLLLFCLWAEALANSQEGPSGATLSFKLTPATRMAVLLLDGRFAEALDATAPPGAPPPLWTLARGLAVYRSGDRTAATRWLDAAAVLIDQPICAESFEAFKKAAAL